MSVARNRRRQLFNIINECLGYLIFVVFSCDSDPSGVGEQVHNLCKGYVPLGVQMTAVVLIQVRIRKRCKEIHTFFKWNLGDVAVCDVMFVFDLL